MADKGRTVESSSASGRRKMMASRSRLSVTLALGVLAGALVAFGLTQAIAQEDNLNSQPSTSKAADAGHGSIQPTATQRKVLWAVVNGDGTLDRGRGVRDVNRLDPGEFEVLFDQNVRTCAYVASIGLSGHEGTASPGQISTVGRFGARNGVFVATQNSSGGLASRSFHLVVNCPV
jgi:hypothetical protein